MYVNAATMPSKQSLPTIWALNCSPLTADRCLKTLEFSEYLSIFAFDHYIIKHSSLFLLYDYPFRHLRNEKCANQGYASVRQGVFPRVCVK